MRFGMTFGFILFMLIVAAAPTALAQVSGQVEISPLRVQGLVVGKKLVFDSEFAKKHQVKIEAPFEFIVPKEKDVQIFASFPPETGGEWVKISFATEKKELIENLRVTGLTVPMMDREKRVAVLGELITKQGLPRALKGYEKSTLLGSRRTTVNDLDAVEAAAVFQPEGNPPMLLWLVGILKPDAPHGVMVMCQIVPDRSEVKKAEDLGKKGLGAQAVSTFKFIDK